MLIKRTPHPARTVFKKNGIIFGDVARTLGISYTYCTAILSGLQIPSPRVNKHLQALAREIEKEAKKPRQDEGGTP